MLSPSSLPRIGVLRDGILVNIPIQTSLTFLWKLQINLLKSFRCCKKWLYGNSIMLPLIPRNGLWNPLPACILESLPMKWKLHSIFWLEKQTFLSGFHHNFSEFFWYRTPFYCGVSWDWTQMSEEKFIITFFWCIGNLYANPLMLVLR